jgi:large subunit ribosomal protein L10
MPTAKKQEMVAELRALLDGSPSAIVTDYRGLTVADIAAVRRTLRERGITYRVIKNRLARIAAREAGLAELDPLLEGPSALAVGQVDEIVLARSFLEAVRPYRTVTVRGGLLRGRRIESAAVERLATLPGREVLLGQLAGGMIAPLNAMASLLAAPLRNLGYALQQVASQKAEANGGVAAATAPSAPSKPEAGAPASAPQARAPAPSTETTAEPVASAEPAAPSTEATAEPVASGEPAATEGVTQPEAAESAPQAAKTSRVGRESTAKAAAKKTASTAESKAEPTPEPETATTPEATADAAASEPQPEQS